MIELLALAMLAMVGLAIAAVIGFVFFVLKLVFWIVFFPIRLLFKLLWIPFGLTLGALGFGLGMIGLPLLLLFVGGVLIFGLVAALFVMMIPLVPFVLFGLLLWAVFRKRPAAA